MKVDYQKIISKVYTDIIAKENFGKVPNYIPELACIHENKFGINFTDLKHNSFGIGDFEEKFSIQSISKVFALSYVYEKLGEKLWSRVDVEPSGNAFNSLVQLEADHGIPRNPFINAGALVICDILLEICNDPKQELLQFIRDLTADHQIFFNEIVAASEMQNSFRNAAMCNYMKSFGNIKNKPDAVIELYCHLCAIEMTCKQLSRSFLYLANEGKIPSKNDQILSFSKAKRINAILLTCGFYDESGEFSFLVGLPGKSGVGGGIVAIYPQHYCITVWSPKLNEKGNSYRGMKFLEEFTTQTGENIF
ncbi:glutaminase [Kaistella jeonii]|uniref:Glutaminase n=1 Tax=Kaistella jeonii TaxID=266749 RepID=A0A0C1FEI1_9FLAO|nr:glutaminase [Kaistella jeonii]KIA90193.1 glutaminase [Kaistella jeonii]SFB76498.1 L-glutaminase [Kaistella jeonii]VEI96487.1 Thermolabile glutaminase [Kaistella jeonii]